MEMKTSKKLMLALVPIFALVLVMSAVAVPAQGAIDGYGYVYLTDDGATENYLTTDWRIYVEIPSYLGLDESYWNITVYGEEINGTGSAVSDHYIVTFYVDDGATNLSHVANLDPIKYYETAPVTWANISIDSVDIATMVVNSDATIFVKISVDSPTTVLDSYHTDVVIQETQMVAMVWAIVPPVLSVALICIVVGWMGQIFKKMKR